MALATRTVAKAREGDSNRLGTRREQRLRFDAETSGEENEFHVGHPPRARFDVLQNVPRGIPAETLTRRGECRL